MVLFHAEKKRGRLDFAEMSPLLWDITAYLHLTTLSFFTPKIGMHFLNLGFEITIVQTCAVKRKS